MAGGGGGEGPWTWEDCQGKRLFFGARRISKVRKGGGGNILVNRPPLEANGPKFPPGPGSVLAVGKFVSRDDLGTLGRKPLLQKMNRRFKIFCFPIWEFGAGR